MLGVREGYLEGMMLKPRAEGKELSHFLLGWGEDTMKEGPAEERGSWL